MKKQEKPKYNPPKVVSYTNKEILEEVGLSFACSGSDGCMSAN